MKYKFEQPRVCRITFATYPGGKTRILTVSKCVAVYVKKELTVVYVARDGKNHRHKYDPHRIAMIICGVDVIYENKRRCI